MPWWDEVFGVFLNLHSPSRWAPVEVMQNASRAQARDRVKVAARCTSASV